MNRRDETISTNRSVKGEAAPGGEPSAPCPQRLLHATNLAIGHRHGRRPPFVVRDGIDLSLFSGQLVCLLGPNGIGKSTLLRTLAGLQPPLAGAIEIEGLPLAELEPRELAHRLAIVLTERLTLSNMTVLELVRLGRHPHTDWTGRLSQADHQAVQWALAATGLESLQDRPLAELSDGERQKGMIARAIAQETRVLVLDEPTAFLDLPRRVEILRRLRDLAHHCGRAVLLSTHDLDLALRSADLIWLMSEGAPLAIGAPEDLILRGSFQQAFATNGIHFDELTGSFQIKDPVHETVCLLGAAHPTIDHWTRHALLRGGYVVESEGYDHPIHVEVLAADPVPHWRVAIGRVETDHDSLAGVLARLEELTSGQASPNASDPPQHP